MIPLNLTTLKIGTAVLLLSAAGGWWHARDGRLRAEGRAEAAEARVDSIVAVADSVAARVAEVDSAARLDVARADSARFAAERRAVEARARRPEIVERIVHAPDTLSIRAAVEDLEAAHEVEVLSLHEALAQADSVIRAKDRQIAARDEAIDRIQAALDASLAARAASRQTSQGFLETWSGRVLAFGAGAGLGYLAGR